MKATLTNFNQSPRKIRSVASLLRGKTVSYALAKLEGTDTKFAEPLYKLIKSAIANSEEKDTNNLIIEKINVDQGIKLKRSRPRAKGSAYPITKRSSIIKVELKK